MSSRFNTMGLTELVDELAGGAPIGQHLPIGFRIDGKIVFYARLSIEMVQEDAANHRPFRALVITPEV